MSFVWLVAGWLLPGCYVTQKDWADRLDHDGDGFDADIWGQCDCDDDDAGIHPGVAETHDGVDENCDGLVDNSTYTQLSLGAYHSCAQNEWGGWRCWGYNGYGQIAVDVESELSSLSSGDFHTCALAAAGGQASCWGADDGNEQKADDGDEEAGAATSNDKGQAAAPTGTFLTIAAGRYHTCAVESSGDIACWGIDVSSASNFGQVTEAPPVKSGDAHVVYVAVSAGVDHSCAIRQDGSAECWGSLASPEADDTGTAAPAFTQIDSGESVACGVLQDGTLTCWGDDTWSLVSAVPEGQFSAVAVGDTHACALGADGTVTCWGDDGARDSFVITPDTDTDGTDTDSDSDGADTDTDGTDTGVVEALPADGRVTAAPTGTGYKAVGAGKTHSCAIDADAVAVCWGGNVQRQGTPVKVATEQGLTSCEQVAR